MFVFTCEVLEYLFYCSKLTPGGKKKHNEKKVPKTDLKIAAVFYEQNVKFKTTFNI